jgi:hypothetical protein
MCQRAGKVVAARVLGLGCSETQQGCPKIKQEKACANIRNV